MTIGLIDYGAGNLASVVKALTFVGANVRLITRASDADDAAGIVVPGVGHFRATTGISEAIRSRIADSITTNVPLLGICLGMQWLFDGSDEAPATPGLGVFHGRITRLTGDVKIPHVGWNSLDSIAPYSRLLDGLPAASSVYFTHTYAAPAGAATTATTSHGATFASVVESGLVFGTQFHPEKSGRAGLRILANFLDITRQARPAC